MPNFDFVNKRSKTGNYYFNTILIIGVIIIAVKFWLWPSFSQQLKSNHIKEMRNLNKKAKFHPRSSSGGFVGVDRTIVFFFQWSSKNILLELVLLLLSKLDFIWMLIHFPPVSLNYCPLRMNLFSNCHFNVGIILR